MMKFETVDQYFEQAPPESLEYLKQVRETLQAALPETNEVISYNMPAFKDRKVLVYYAWHPNHIGFYPTPSAFEAFSQQLQAYKFSKGAVQFPYSKPLPLSLIREMAIFRYNEEKK